MLTVAKQPTRILEKQTHVDGTKIYTYRMDHTNIENQTLQRLENAVKQITLGQFTYVDYDANKAKELLELTWEMHCSHSTPYILGHKKGNAQHCVVPFLADENIRLWELDELIVKLRSQHNLDRLTLMISETDSTTVLYQMRSGVSDFTDLPIRSRDEKSQRLRQKQRAYVLQNAQNFLSQLLSPSNVKNSV